MLQFINVPFYIKGIYSDNTHNVECGAAILPVTDYKVEDHRIQHDFVEGPSLIDDKISRQNIHTNVIPIQIK